MVYQPHISVLTASTPFTGRYISHQGLYWQYTTFAKGTGILVWSSHTLPEILTPGFNPGS